MRSLYIPVVVLLASSPAALAQAGPSGTSPGPEVRKQIQMLEEEWHNAYVKHDAEPLQRILADEYVSVGARRTHDKAQTIEELRADTTAYEYSTPYDLDIRRYGDVAVVIGKTKEKGRSRKGHDFEVEYRWTDVFVLRDGRWQVVAAQVAVVPPPAPPPAQQ